MPRKKQKLSRYQTYRRRKTPHLHEGLEWLRGGIRKMISPLIGLTLLGIGVRICFSYFLFSDYFRVDKVEVYCDNIHSILENFESYSIHSKSLLHQINLSGLKQEVLKNHPEFKSVVVKKVLPNTLRIEIETRRPVAQILLGQYFPVDSDGRILPAPKNLADPGLPVIKGMTLEVTDLKVGREYRSNRLIKALTLLAAIQSTQVVSPSQIAVIDVMDHNSIDFYLKNGIQVKIGKEDFPERLKVLSRVLSHSTLPQDQIRYIDLRFDDPAIGPKGKD